MPARSGERRSKEIARWLVDEQKIDGWGAQAVTVSYERARGRRAVGEFADGFAITASKTVAVPVERLYDAFVDESLRRRWLPDAELRERTATRPKNARFDWGDDGTRVVVGFIAKGDALVGWGGFKGPPRDGVVELGYSVAPSWEGRGLATASVLELLREIRPRGRSPRGRHRQGVALPARPPGQTTAGSRACVSRKWLPDGSRNPESIP